LFTPPFALDLLDLCVPEQVQSYGPWAKVKMSKEQLEALANTKVRLRGSVIVDLKENLALDQASHCVQ
jgi:hypothetical protein